MRGRLYGSSVDEHLTVHNLYGLTRQTDGPLDEILFLVHRTYPYLTEVVGIGKHALPPILTHQVVIRPVALEGRAHRVTIRVVEDSGIEPLHMSSADEPMVGELYPVEIRFDTSLRQRQNVVDKRNR